MAPKEYAKLDTEDLESPSCQGDVSPSRCRECSADINQDSINSPVRHSQEAFGKVKALLACVCILLLTANVGILVLWTRTTPHTIDCVRPLLTYSPAKADGAIRYERERIYNDIESNIFTGPPRQAYHDAWARLIEPLAIKISEEELDLIGENSIKFVDGSGYLAELSVYHELHCIKQVRRHKHLDYYYPNMTKLERYREELHYGKASEESGTIYFVINGRSADHCLEYWREAAMCRADTSLASYFWREGEIVSEVYSNRECVNWEQLDLWARSRMVDMSDISILEGPSGKGGRRAEMAHSVFSS